MNRLHPHHPLRWLLVLTTLLVAGIFLGPKAHEALNALKTLNHVSVGWVIVAVVAELASLVVFSGVTFALLPRDVRPPFGRVLRLDLVTIALSHAVPAGSAAGTALGYGLLSEEGVAAVPAGFAKVTQSLISAAMLQVLLWVTVGLDALTGPASNSALAASAAGGLMIIVLIAFGASMLRHDELTSRIVVRLLGWLPRLDRERVRRFVQGLAERARQLRHDPRRLAAVCAASMANWIFDLVSLWAAFRAFGYSAGLVSLTIAFCVAQVVGALPISPAGLGLIEGSLVLLLTQFGTPGNVAVLATLLWRLCNYWLPFPIGLAAYLAILWDRHLGRLPRPPISPVLMASNPERA